MKDMGRVMRLLADRKTMATVLVEQCCDFVAEMAHQYLVMQRGEIVRRERQAKMESDRVKALVFI
jgi:urea transport system ATP-binding protein